jgi:hypothetical protein
MCEVPASEECLDHLDSSRVRGQLLSLPNDNHLQTGVAALVASANDIYATHKYNAAFQGSFGISGREGSPCHYIPQFGETDDTSFM